MSRLSELVIDYVNAKENAKELDAKIKDLQNNIIVAMDKKSIKEFSVSEKGISDTAGRKYIVKLVETQKLEYDAQKAMEKCPSIVSKTYFLNDSNKTAFIVCLKKMGIDKKQCAEILSTLNVEYDVSTEKLSALIDKGEISPKVLNQIACVKQKSRFIRINSK